MEFQMYLLAFSIRLEKQVCFVQKVYQIHPAYFQFHFALFLLTEIQQLTYQLLQLYPTLISQQHIRINRRRKLRSLHQFFQLSDDEGKRSTKLM